MLRILLLLFISQLSVVLASGCHTSRARDEVDDNDASFESDSANSGDRSTDSTKENNRSSDDSDGSTSDTSSKSEDKQDAASSGTGGVNGTPSGRPQSDASNDSGATAGSSGQDETAGTEASPKPKDAGAPDEPDYEDDFPELSCSDEECINMVPIPDIICCTTGEPPHSDAEDMCGIRLPPFPMAPDGGLDTAGCIQMNRPGEIDNACPAQQTTTLPFFGTEVGCCTKSGYCGGWSEDGMPFFSLGCFTNPSVDEQPVPCRLFETPQECRDVYAERGELTGAQGCVCDHCLYRFKACRRNLGCVRIWECMLQSGCRDVDDCYLNPNSPCQEQFEQYDAVSLSYALRLSSCVKSNCE